MSTSWQHHCWPSEAGEIHVWPVGDVIEHELDGVECVCGPAVEPVEAGVIVRHASLDGREVKLTRRLHPPVP